MDVLQKKVLLDSVQAVLEKNHVVGKTFDYTAPALPKYPHQWLWDSCFAAIILAKLDNSRAQAELFTLLSTQRPDGFIPLMTMWGGPSILEYFSNKLCFDGKASRLTQLPMLGIALEEVFRATEDENFLRKVLPLAEKYFLWLSTERDLDGDGLASIIHPWEATDDSPAFDEPLLGRKARKPGFLETYFRFYRLLMKYRSLGWDNERIFSSGIFNVENVLFNSIYAAGWQSLSKLAGDLSDKERQKAYSQKAEKILDSLLKNCWDEKTGLFYDVFHRQSSHQPYRVATISSLAPLLIKGLPGEIAKKLVAHLTDEKEFATSYPVPFVSRGEQTFSQTEESLLWRGPVWINTNWLLARGLAMQGFSEVARDLAEKTISLVAKNGFWEFYDPFTGKGMGQKDYTWSALVVNLFDYL